MKRILLAVPVLALLISTPAFVGSPAPGAEDTELELHMKEINKSMRELRKAIKDPAKAAECLGLVLGVQEHALAAKRLDPKMLATIKEAAAKTQFTIDYRKEMHAFLGKAFELEVALLEDRNEDAQATLTTLLKSKGPAHEKFQLEDH